MHEVVYDNNCLDQHQQCHDRQQNRNERIGVVCIESLDAAMGPDVIRLDFCKGCNDGCKCCQESCAAQEAV